MAITVGGINDRVTLNNNLASNDYLQVNCCGIFENISEESRTYRPDGRKDFQIILIIDGYLSLNHFGETLEVGRNSFILIPPHVENDYRFSDPVNAVWVHFTGIFAGEILRTFSIEAFTVYEVSDTGNFRHCAEKIIKELQFKKTGWKNMCNSYLLRFLTHLKRKIDENAEREAYSSGSDIGIAVDEMKTNFAANTGIEHYAKMCSMSVSRYSHVFTQKMSVSPHRYLTELRIGHAKFLLTNTNAKILDIAKSVGFADPFYFSKAFKKETGFSPSEFRKNKEKEI